MPIDTRHPEYLHREPDWISCRDAMDGQRAIKAAGTRYLPMLTGQSSADYASYRERALYYSITDKTVSALSGMALGKPPEVELPDKMKKAMDDNQGIEFMELLHEAISEDLLMGRYGVLVDRGLANGNLRNSVFLAEDILNWQYNDNEEFSRVVLREIYFYADDADKYAYLKRERFYDLYLDAEGYYAVDVYERACGNPGITPQEPVQKGTTIYPTNTGVRMKYIPFYVANPLGLGLYDYKPPMLDIVNINISHYRTSADLEHGRHFTGMPTPYVTGTESQAQLKIGSLTAWIIPDPSAKVGYLEFTGQGLQSLEKALSEKQSQLASLSARLIDSQSRGSEAAETVKLRYTSETASLKTVVRAVGALMNKVYMAHADMSGLDKTKVKIALNMDFLDERLVGAALDSLVNSYLGGAISEEVFLYNLRRGDVMPPPGQDVGTLPTKPPIVAPTPAAKPTTP